MLEEGCCFARFCNACTNPLFGSLASAMAARRTKQGTSMMRYCTLSASFMFRQNPRS